MYIEIHYKEQPLAPLFCFQQFLLKFTYKPLSRLSFAHMRILPRKLSYEKNIILIYTVECCDINSSVSRFVVVVDAK